MFDVSDRAARDVTETKMIDVSKLEGVEYSYEVFLFGFAAFTGG